MKEGSHARLAKAKARAAREDADDAEASEGGESVEPSGEEGGESESPKEEDDVDDEESTGVKSEDNKVKEETESDNEEVVEEEEPEVTQEITKGDKGKGKGSASQTGASPVGAGTDLGTTMSSSSTMHNLLAGSLATANAENRQRIRAQLAALAERAANDFLTEDENMERMALEEELERLNKEAEDLRARGRARASPKAATERLSQEHHDARYRMARAKGVSHAKAWKAEKARRRAALNRRQGVANRAKSRIEHELSLIHI